jgi:hypothetical protein
MDISNVIFFIHSPFMYRVLWPTLPYHAVTDPSPFPG